VIGSAVPGLVPAHLVPTTANIGVAIGAETDVARESAKDHRALLSPAEGSDPNRSDCVESLIHEPLEVPLCDSSGSERLCRGHHAANR
jgi:hypothetical protein